MEGTSFRSQEEVMLTDQYGGGAVPRAMNPETSPLRGVSLCVVRKKRKELATGMESPRVTFPGRKNGNVRGGRERDWGQTATVAKGKGYYVLKYWGLRRSTVPNSKDWKEV